MLSTTAMMQLDAYQNRIYALIETAQGLLPLTSDAAQPGLAHLRWQLLRLLREYQLFKHNEIFNPLMESSQPDLVAMATRLKASCIASGEEYRLHTTRWSGRGATEDWSGYQQATSDIIEGLYRHLQAERADVQILLSKVSRTRRP